MHLKISLASLFFASLNLNAGIPFSPDVKLGVNYSIFFSALKAKDSSAYPNYAIDFSNLKNCNYFKGENVPIKLFNDLSLGEAIEKTDKEIFLGIDNYDLLKIANNMAEAHNWVEKNEKYFVQDVNGRPVQRVKAIHVGNEIFAAANWDKSIYQNTAKAMQNIINVLKEKNLSHIKVTTTTCCALIVNSERIDKRIPSMPGYEIPDAYTGGYEPPFTEINPEFKEEFKKILKIIAENDSFLSINLYPPFAIRDLENNPNMPKEVVQNVTDMGLFRKKAATGNYLIEDMVRGYDFAIKKLNIEDPSVPAYVDYVISEIGWPRHVYSPTDSNSYVSVDKSKEFYQGLKNFANSYVRKLDTYIDPKQSYSQKVPIFIFSFRDEKNKPNMFEPYWGLYTDEENSRDETGLCTADVKN